MYEYLSGTLKNKKPAHAVIDVQGVGYILSVSLATFSALPDIGKPCTLFTYLHVREDILQLYGFATVAERELFLLLNTISGIGPKLANTVVSGIGIDRLRQAIATGDVDTLTSAPGVGKKTAQRLVVELKEKIASDTNVTIDLPILNADATMVNDALSALMALGYKRQEASQAIRAVCTGATPPKNVEAVIREALGQLTA